MSLLTGIAAYYKLDDASDASGNSHTLTNNNSVAFDAGLIGNGADFGSPNSSKSLSAASNLGVDQSASAVSISLWVRMGAEISSGEQDFAYLADNNANVDLLIGYAYNGGARELLFQRSRNGLGTVSALASATLGTSAWRHIVLTYDLSTITGYLDGSSVATLSASGVGNSGMAVKFALGNNGASGNYAGAKVDEVGVWSRVLTSAEVTQLYNGGAGLQYPFPQSLSLGLTTGYYALTGGQMGIARQLSMALATGYYALTGNPLSAFLQRGWSTLVKSMAAWANGMAKGSSTWSNLDKS